MADRLPPREFRRLIRLLRHHFPTKLRVEVRRKPRFTFRGAYHQRRRKRVGPRGGISYPYVHLIEVDSREGIETVIHEWAHALRRERNPAARHDDAFWSIYGQMYRSFIDP